MLKCPFCVTCHVYMLVCDSDFVAKNTTTTLTILTRPVVVNSVFGWIIYFQRVDLIFNWQLNISTFKAGFGSPDSNFFLGLDNLYNLLTSASYRARVEIQELGTGRWLSAEYARYTMDPALNSGNLYWYLPRAYGYSGDAGDEIPKGIYFVTYDHNTGTAPPGGCGWWYNGVTCIGCLAGSAPNYNRYNGISVAIGRLMIKQN